MLRSKGHYGGFPWSEIVVEDKLVELSSSQKNDILYRVIIIDDVIFFL